LECFMPNSVNKYSLCDAFIAAGLSCCVEPYNHTPRGYWKITTDGSLGDYNHGIEVVSPVLNGADGFSQLRKACKVLADKHCHATAKCGLHVHVGWKGGTLHNPLWDAATLRQLIKMHNRYEPVIDSLIHPSRRGSASHYCQSNQPKTHPHYLATARTWQEVCLAIGQSPDGMRNADRFKKVNLKPIGAYGTVEFRQHHGTVKSEEVEQWLRFVLRLVLAAKQQVEWPESPLTFEELKKIIALDSNEAKHFQRRLNGFARPTQNRRMIRRRRDPDNQLYNELERIVRTPGESS
jgi:hypothetical protein